MITRLNLAPEVYQASQRGKQRKRVATTLGIVISVVVGAIVVVELVVLGGQKVLLSTLNSAIAQRQTKVTSYANLQTAVTAQQHLLTWEQLMGQQGKFSQFFQVLQEFAPQGVAASSVTVGADNSLAMTGTANTYNLVAKFAQALAASNVTIGPNHAASNQPYFTNVQITSVGSDGATGGVGFQLTTQMSSEVTSGQ